jgi:hypothetical protein
MTPRDLDRVELLRACLGRRLAAVQRAIPDYETCHREATAAARFSAEPASWQLQQRAFLFVTPLTRHSLETERARVTELQELLHPPDDLAPPDRSHRGIG